MGTLASQRSVAPTIAATPPRPSPLPANRPGGRVLQTRHAPSQLSLFQRPGGSR